MVSPAFSCRTSGYRNLRLRSVGHTWARSASRRIHGGLNQMASDLHKHEAGYMAGTRQDSLRYMVLWARREPGPVGTDTWRTDRGGYRRSGTPLALAAFRPSPWPSAPRSQYSGSLAPSDARVLRWRASLHPQPAPAVAGSAGGRCPVRSRYTPDARDLGRRHCRRGPEDAPARADRPADPAANSSTRC
jgi:hypothetical protein